MDNAPYTGDLDLGAVSTRDDLAALLQTVRIRADTPSLRTLEARTRHSPTPLSKTTVADMLKGNRLPRKAVMVAFLQACGVQDDNVELWQRTWERIATGEDGTAPPQDVRTTAGPGHAALAGQPTQATNDTPDAGRTKQAHRDRKTGGNTTSTDRATIRQLLDQVTRLLDQVTRLTSDNEKLRAQLAATPQQATKRRQPDDAAGAQRPPSPVVSGRELGVLLRAMREEKGMTVEQVAQYLRYSPNTVKRMEAGFRSGTVRDVHYLCTLYEVTEAAQRDHLMQLADESKQQGWWHSHHLDFGTYVGLEEAAASTSYYQSVIIPGVLQTADYARAVHKVVVPKLLPERIDELVEVRMTRQRRLTQDNPLRFTAVLDEAALHRVIGGRRVMAAQLSKILEMSALPNIVIHVLPYELGAHPAMESNFVILDFAAPVSSAVFVEGLLGIFCLDRRKDIEDIKRYKLVFKDLCATALSQEESIKKIANASKDLKR